MIEKFPSKFIRPIIAASALLGASPQLQGCDSTRELDTISSNVSNQVDASVSDLYGVTCVGFPKPCKNGTCDGGVGVHHCETNDAGNEVVQCRCE